MWKWILVGLWVLSGGVIAGEQPLGPQMTQVGQRSAVLTLERMEIEGRVRGPLTRTRATLVFRNPWNRPVEGELVFPLTDGARVSGYALDIQGRLVDAVPVTRRKARVVFEKEVRRRVDPGLVEWTVGNHFKTRVFPIPPKGTRTIRVEWTGRVDDRDGRAVYRLPLRTNGPVGQVQIRLEVDGETAPKLQSAPAGLSFQPWQTLHRAEANYVNQTFNQELVVKIPVPNKPWIGVCSEESESTFLIRDLPQPPKIRARKRAPKRLVILWDGSASRSGGHQTELKFLRTFLTQHSSVIPTRLFVLRDRLTEITLTDRTPEAICRQISQIHYDGGTAFGAIHLTRAEGEVALLFSDGISNWGKDRPVSAIPVYAFSGHSGTDADRLRAFCESTGGAYRRLSEESNLPAIAAGLLKPRFQFLRAEFNPAQIYGVYPRVPREISGSLLCTGKLLTDSADITLVYGVSGKETARKTITLTRPQMNAPAPDRLLTQYWATQKLSHLLRRPKEQADAITELGKQYGLVTPGTSLIVLERLQQYVEHDIRPPATLPEMRRQFDQQIAQRRAGKTRRQSDKLTRLIALWHRHLAWYDNPPKVKPVKKSVQATGRPAPAPRRSLVLRERLEQEVRTDVPGEAAPQAPSLMGIRGRMSSPAASERVDELDDDDDSSEDREGGLFGHVAKRKKSESSVRSSQPAISVKPWDPKTPYLAALREAQPQAYEAIYRNFRKSYTTAPAFYLDVADFLLNHNARQLGLQVLSNIVELKLENAALLRVAAYRLLDAEEVDLAIALLSRVREMRPEEPQSFRDLALAYGKRARRSEEKDDYRQACSLFRQVLFGEWVRFNEIELIALTELNQLIPHARKAGLRDEELKIDPRLIRHLELDVRIVMSWDADNTDLDLHVVEPLGEEAYYGHRHTQMGGLVSRDFTQGYGPESYCLRKATAGSFRVRTRYFGSSQARLAGPVVLRLELFTNYGRANETRRSITRRLDKVRETLDIGELIFQAK